jgi:peptidoglycan/LPS O-acetylase OafA/YrhL
LTNEIKPLTGIRGAAAFLVMLYHYATYPAFAALHWSALQKGYLCVDLFFVLSGFVLALRYSKRFEENPSWTTYSAFIKARVARLYPAYLLIIFLYYAKWTLNFSGVNTTPYTSKEIAANFLLVQSWGILPTRAIIWDSWSVSVEAIAYLLFPLLLVIALEKSIRTAAALALAAIASLGFIAHIGYGVSGPLDEMRVFPQLRCLAEFSLGLLAFRATRIAACQYALSAIAAPLLVFALAAVAFALDKTDVLTVLVFPVIVACLYYDNKVTAALVGNKVIYHLGEISYSLYLIHPFFVTIAGHYAKTAALRFNLSVPLLFVLLGAATTWLAAFLVYRFVEVPGRRFLSVSRAISAVNLEIK